MNFEHWLVSSGYSPATARRYHSAIAGVISSWASKAGLVKQSLHEIKHPEVYQHVASTVTQLAVFEARNTLSKGMYKAALEAYADYLQAGFGEE